MVVDDEPDLLSVISMTLQKYDFQIDVFTNPIKALSHFASDAKDYSLVISDIRMSGMSGTEFLSAVKGLRSDIPIIPMTAYVIYDEQICEALPGMIKEEILHKPFGSAELCGAVKKMLKIAS